MQTVNCLTTAGTVIFFILIIVSFIAGFYVGSFRTKRQAKLARLVKDWKTEVKNKLKGL